MNSEKPESMGSLSKIIDRVEFQPAEELHRAAYGPQCPYVMRQPPYQWTAVSPYTFVIEATVHFKPLPTIKKNKENNDNNDHNG